MDVIEQIKKFQEFVQEEYYPVLLENIRKGNQFLVIDFSKLSKFDPDLANELMDSPEEVIKAAETAVKQFDIEGINNFRARFKNFPPSQKIFIRDIRM